MIQQPSGYWVNTQSHWKTWEELVATAKQQALKVAVLGFGSADDITIILSRQTKGFKFEPIPYAEPGCATPRYSAATPTCSTSKPVTCAAISTAARSGR